MPIIPKYLSVALTLAACISSTAAFAEDITAKSGRATPIDMIVIGNKFSCNTPGKPTMFLRQAPAHGKISFSWVATKYNAEFKGCAGKPIKGMLIVYTPNGGYRGPDNTTIAFSYPTYEGSNTTSGASRTYSIKVQ